MLDLYDMSGNVGEMCNTPLGTFKDGKYSGLYVVEISTRMLMMY